MNYNQFINNPKVGVFILAGLFIYFIFRLLLYFVNKSKNETRQLLKKTIYFFEIIFWFFFIYEGVDLFKNTNKAFSIFCSLILVFAICWSFWFILKDYLAGLYLKMDETLKPGETIEFDGYLGKIGKIGNKSVELELSMAKTVNIPYHQFFIKRIIYTGTTGNCAKENFEFKLNSKLSPIETIETIRAYIYQLPWVSDKYEQEVIIDKMDANGTIIKINASLFDKKYFTRFQQLIKEKFE